MTAGSLDHFTLLQHRAGIVHGSVEIEYEYNISVEEREGLCPRGILSWVGGQMHVHMFAFSLRAFLCATDSFSHWRNIQ